MTPDEVEEIRQQWGGSVYEGAILRLCESHEVQRARIEKLEAALRECATELDRWGWADIYGDTPQEHPVADAVAKARAALEGDS